MSRTSRSRGWPGWLKTLGPGVGGSTPRRYGSRNKRPPASTCSPSSSGATKPPRRFPEPWMTWQAWTTVAVLGLAYGTLTLTRIGPDLVLLGAITVLLTVGVLSERDVLECVGNEAVLTVGVLFVVAAGLRET